MCLPLPFTLNEVLKQLVLIQGAIFGVIVEVEAIKNSLFLFFPKANGQNLVKTLSFNKVFIVFIPYLETHWVFRIA